MTLRYTDAAAEYNQIADLLQNEGVPSEPPTREEQAERIREAVDYLLWLACDLASEFDNEDIPDKLVVSDELLGEVLHMLSRADIEITVP